MTSLNVVRKKDERNGRIRHKASCVFFSNGWSISKCKSIPFAGPIEIFMERRESVQKLAVVRTSSTPTRQSSSPRESRCERVIRPDVFIRPLALTDTISSFALASPIPHNLTHSKLLIQWPWDETGMSEPQKNRRSALMRTHISRPESKITKVKKVNRLGNGLGGI